MQRGNAPVSLIRRTRTGPLQESLNVHRMVKLHHLGLRCLVARSGNNLLFEICELLVGRYSTEEQRQAGVDPTSAEGDHRTWDGRRLAALALAA